jgi:hypothetical protein
MKLRRKPIPTYNQWPVRATRYLTPTFAVRGFNLDGLEIWLCWWVWQVRFEVVAGRSGGRKEGGR